MSSPTPASVPGQDLYRSGNLKGPSPIRSGIDIMPDSFGMVHPSDPPLGMSTFSDPAQLPTRGRVWRLRGEVLLPEGLQAVSDPPPLGHVTIGPSRTMPEEEFLRLLEELPWEDTGQK